MEKIQTTDPDWWGNLFDRSIGDRRICSSESGYHCADKGRDKTGGKVLQSEDCKNEFERYSFCEENGSETGYWKKGRNQV
ncbi:hypothetical protein DWY88_18565 [Mediterraneibacter gnavus]|uniref:Uncharacterized protein n=1 Tax=Mediterraneibacter gnavus TaxID=33038 RepID=A0A412BM04_MEDGN|nr:hypothetical protein C5Y99_13430 [Mediterraneibacter gnavus ATCC 29149]QHB24369.1 hypothetical protein RGna_13380 [Mediterraneibacter gnavus ATCC 29149]RGQ56730.1 hypothetical protein DWY88_18565 [Mediterraneibacter gnavus]RHJ11535.1 hypothetical protein DW142_09355 [Mediterraneibacter gnavus]